MTDLEISIAVAKSLNFAIKDDEPHPLYPDTVWVAGKNDKGDIVTSWQQFVPSFTPNEAMRIIFSNTISLISTGTEYRALSLCGRYERTYTNPLRAGLEVYLMLVKEETAIILSYDNFLD